MQPVLPLRYVAHEPTASCNAEMRSGVHFFASLWTKRDLKIRGLALVTSIWDLPSLVNGLKNSRNSSRIVLVRSIVAVSIVERVVILIFFWYSSIALLC